MLQSILGAYPQVTTQEGNTVEYLIFGLVMAAVIIGVLVVRQRRSSPTKSVYDFERALDALKPEKDKRE
jgi:hypothetical protein